MKVGNGGFSYQKGLAMLSCGPPFKLGVFLPSAKVAAPDPAMESGLKFVHDGFRELWAAGRAGTQSTGTPRSHGSHCQRGGGRRKMSPWQSSPTR